MDMENKNTTNIKTLSPETSLFVESLSKLTELEENLLSAFSEIYGEQQGEDMYHQSPIPGICDTLKDEISKMLGHSIVLSLGDRQRVNDNIL